MSSLSSGVPFILEEFYKMKIDQYNMVFSGDPNQQNHSKRFLLINGCFSNLTLQIRDERFPEKYVYGEFLLRPEQPLVQIELEEGEVLWICGTKGRKVLDSSSKGKKWAVVQTEDGVPTVIREYA